MGCGSSKVVDPNAKVDPLMKSSKERKCRDVLWIAIFVAYLVGMVVVFLTGWKYGDASRLVFAVDSDGNQCGGKDSVCYNGEACGPFAVYPHVDKDIAAAMRDGLDVTDVSKLLTIPFYTLCLSSCPEGPIDMNGDGQTRDWVCHYDTLKQLDTNYPATASEDRSNKEIPTLAGKARLNECMDERAAIGGPLAEYFLGEECRTLLTGCFKHYLAETNMFFRCVPEAVETTTCAVSPYLEENGQDVATMLNSKGETVVRPSTHPKCGKCIDPEFDADGKHMAPDAEECKAKQVKSTSEVTEVRVNPIFEQVSTWTAALQRYMGDVQLTYDWIILCGAVGAMVIGVVWLVLIRFLAPIFVWVVIWALLLCFAFLSVQFLIYGNVIDTAAIASVISAFTSDTNATEEVATSIVDTVNLFDVQEGNQEQLFRISGFIMVGITGVYLLLILALHRKIRLAVQVLREATKVIAVMPFILLFPIVTSVFSVCAGVYWVFTSMLISSSGEIQLKELAGADTVKAIILISNNTVVAEIGAIVVQEFQSASLNNWLWVYNFFGYLWLNQVIQAVSACTIAGAVASHYWASEHENEKAKKMPKWPVLASLKRTLRFHLGSLIFGAFIIALVQLIRAALAYLDKKTQSLQKTNRVVRIAMKLVQCCLWCFEKILKFVTKHAFIQIAIKGSSFCTATREAFLIMLTNLATVGVATAINNLILFFAKLVIAVGSASLCWLTITTFVAEEDSPSSLLVPVVITFMLAWFVGSLFMSVYALAVDTILICYCEDSKANDGSPTKPYYMSNGLKKIARKSNKMFKREAQSRKEASEVENDDSMSVGPEEEAKPLL